MRSKNRSSRRLPAIVPRFLKNAVTIGAIPALVGCDKGESHKRAAPVVATYVEPAVVAAYMQDAPSQVPIEVPAVVAAMVGDQRPPVPQPPRDAGVDAATPKKKPPKVDKPPPKRVLGVAAMFAPDFGKDLPPPPVVAAMLPDQNVIAPPPPPKKTKRP